MNKKTNFEFVYFSPKEKRKVLIGKGLLALVMAYCTIMLVVDASPSLSTNLLKASGILLAFFAYLNLLQVKSELAELCRRPYQIVGLEFLFAAICCGIASLYWQTTPLF